MQFYIEFPLKLKGQHAVFVTFFVNMVADPATQTSYELINIPNIGTCLLNLTHEMWFTHVFSGLMSLPSIFNIYIFFMFPAFFYMNNK